MPLARQLLLRRMGSNHRPSGYEPDELPLLYSAIYRLERTSKTSFEPNAGAKVLLFFDMSKFLTKKVPKICFFTLNYSFGRINLAQ